MRQRSRDLCNWHLGSWHEFLFADESSSTDHQEGEGKGEFDDNVNSFPCFLSGLSKPKRKRLRHQDYIPRVVKHGIRRFYARMLGWL